MAKNLGLTFDEAIAYSQQREVVLPDVYYNELQGIQRAKAFSVAGLTFLEQLQMVLDMLNISLMEGTTFKDWKKKVLKDESLALPNYRLVNVFRTGIQSAYMRGSWEQIAANTSTHPYLMYDAVNDSRTRPSHHRMDGIIRPVGDSFWSTHHPLNGFQCRCTTIPLTASQAEERGGVTPSEDIPADAVPDKGWEYNVGEAYMNPPGVPDPTTVINPRTGKPKMSPVLKDALDKTSKNTG